MVRSVDDDDLNLCQPLNTGTGAGGGPAQISQKYTFGKQGCRDIAMQNMRLAGRLDEIKKRPKKKLTTSMTPIASSAINRKRRDNEIDRKNMLISRRLGEVKSSVALGSKSGR